MEDDDDPIPISPPSLKAKLRHSLCFSCCFNRRHYRHQQRRRNALDSPHPRFPPQGGAATPSDEKPTLIWKGRKDDAGDLKDERKDKCMTVLNCVANGSTGKQRRYASAEFRYDPLSYSLNFEDGFEDDDAAPLRNFSSRLPASPPVKTAAVAVREIPAFS